MSTLHGSDPGVDTFSGILDISGCSCTQRHTVKQLGFLDFGLLLLFVRNFRYQYEHMRMVTGNANLINVDCAHGGHLHTISQVYKVLVCAPLLLCYQSVPVGRN